jgi:hypothetical protein
MLRPWLAGVVKVLFSYSGDRAIAVLVMTALLVCAAYFRQELSDTWEHWRGEKAAFLVPVDATFAVDPVTRAYTAVVLLTLACMLLGAVGFTVEVGPDYTRPLFIISP